MRKFGKESTAPAEGVNRESGGWLQNHCALAVCVVVILAFVLRTVFAYGFSADNGFALSGGSEAQYHLHVVESILNGSFILGSDAAINYPIGGLNVNAPLYDFLAAGVGSFAGASTALAVLAPIFGALTCFPVYLIGKELYGYKTGFVAALIYGLMALPIVSTVLSNGTEYAFVAFLLSLLILALIKVSRKVADGVLAKKETIVAGILLGLVVLSWNDFRAIIVLLVIVMVIQMVLDRFNSKDFSAPLYTYSIIMLVGLVIGAIYYIPANLWDAVFSGPVLIAVIAIAFGFIFKALQKAPWIFVIPGLIIAFAVIAAVLFFVMPDYFTALIFGNNTYSNSLMSDIVRGNVSISKMSSYYGWLLMWMPAILGVWEFYRYSKKERTHSQLFVTMTMLVLWMFAWTSYSCAAALGLIFAVSSAYVLVTVLAMADLKSYWASMRTAGFPGCFRKMIKPLPFVSVLVAVFLVAVPTAAYAVDAGIPSNADSGYVFYGNTVYTIETGDSYPATYTYDDLTDKDKAVVTWVDGATSYEAQGYKTVNDAKGAGASNAAQIYLAEGADGATAAQIFLMIKSTDDNLSSAFGADSAVYDKIKGYMADPKLAKELVLGDSDKYGNLSSDIDDDNAVYLASINEITDNMTSGRIFDTYENICDITGNDIGYYVVDGSMVPLVYGDGSSLSTIAYFAGYTVDGYGAASQFFSYITYYSNYYPMNATDAFYETFLWKALIGSSPSEAGYTSSFSYLYDLTTSNGTVKPMPGYGLAGYSIASWYVKYNADPQATTADDGWEYMSYYDAIEKQQKDGGLINYLSSIIAYKYTGTGSVETGVVTDEDGNILAGITVSVSYYNETYGADMVYSETKTDSEGNFMVLIPSDSYTITYKNGTVKLGTSATVQSASFVGRIALGGITPADVPDYLYVLKDGSKEYYIQTVGGVIDSSEAKDGSGNSVKIVPGTYTYELRDSSAASVSSGSVTLYSGTNSGLMVSPTNYTITATVTDIFGQSLNAGTVVATNSTTGDKYSADVAEGKAVIYVPSGTYTVNMYSGYVATNTTSLSVTSNRTVSITAYDANMITVSGAPVITAYGGSYSTVAVDGEIGIPMSIGSTMYNYTIYAIDGDNVLLGVYDGSPSPTLNKSKALKVTGTIGTSGTVTFVAETGAMISAVAGSDGKFNALIPAGEYDVYATNGSDKVYIASQNITEDKELSITMVDGKKITVTYNYASNTSKSNVAIPFAYVEAYYTYDSTNYVLPSMTDTSGKATFVIPDASTNAKVVINGGAILNDGFDYDELTSTIDDGTSDVSKTITIPKDKMKAASVKSDYTMKLTPYGSGDDIEYTAGETKEIAPGQYTAKIDAATGYYFSGTVYVYPGATEFSGLKPTHVFGITITKGANDVLTITGDGTHDNYNDDDVYYFEYDVEYTVKSVNSETKNIKYATVYRDVGDEAETIDMTTSAATMKITGYVGAVADGTVKVTYLDGTASVTVDANVSSGAFEIELPSSVTSANFSADVTKTVSSQKYSYTGAYTAESLKDGAIVNVPVVSVLDTDDYSLDLDGYIESASFDDGNMSVTLVVHNNTDLVKSYAITAGSAWNLNENVQVMVLEKSSETITVEGTYEPNGSGVGTNGMSITISDFNGTSSKTIQIVDGSVTTDGEVTLKTAKDTNNKDKVSGNEYLYALTLVNTGKMGAVEINATVEAGYSVRIMNADGSLIKLSGESFIAAAQKSTVVYVKVMKENGEMDVVPNVSVSTSVGDVTLTPSTMKVEVSSVEATGDNAVSERSGIPLGFWFIIGLNIILLILIVWMGSKRGVFSRR